jgi:acetone carboxylase gamma subunit
MGQMVHLDQPRFIMREFFCPNCALRIALDIARPDIDPVIHAAQLDEGWVMEHFVSKVATLKAPAITTTTDGVR